MDGCRAPPSQTRPLPIANVDTSASSSTTQVQLTDATAKTTGPRLVQCQHSYSLWTLLLTLNLVTLHLFNDITCCCLLGCFSYGYILE